MSDREQSQVTQGVESAANTELPPPVGNRPAQDARQVDAPNPVDGDWRGGEDATDFLGLDLEVGAGAANVATTTPSSTDSETVSADAAPAPTDPSSSSWLLSLGDASRAKAGQQAVAEEASETTAITESTESTETSETETGEPSAEEWTETEGGDPTPDGAESTDARPADSEAPRRGRRRPVVLALAALVVAAAAVGAYQWEESQNSNPDEPLLVNGTHPATTKHAPSKTPADDSTESPIAKHTDDSSAAAHGGTGTHTGSTNDDLAHATADTGTETSKHGDASTLGDASTVAGSTETSTSSSHDAAVATASATDAQPGAEIFDATRLRETRLAGERIESWLHGRDGSTTADAGTSPPVSPPFASDALPGARSPIEERDEHSPNFGMSRSPLTSPGAPRGGVEDRSQPILKSRFNDKSGSVTRGGLRHASADDLAGVWEGSVIPMDAISSPSRLLTPGVGRVRAVIQHGEIFEGNLYAVGQGLIWIDTDVGRLALLSDQVQRIEHLTSRVRASVLGAPGSQELAGLPRVRVHTPGGTFYGKVIARDDGTVTLITDEGARVMLESRDVESAPVGVKSFVVKPPAKH
jgi:hypothetical protein